MEMNYSPAELAFLASSLEELRTRVQALLRKGGDPLQRQGLTNLLEEVKQAERALEAGPGEGGFAAGETSTFYTAAYAQRRKINQFLDTSVCPADKRNELVSAASSVNALLRKLKADLGARGVDADEAMKKEAAAR